MGYIHFPHHVVIRARSRVYNGHPNSKYYRRASKKQGRGHGCLLCVIHLEAKTSRIEKTELEYEIIVGETAQGHCHCVLKVQSNGLETLKGRLVRSQYLPRSQARSAAAFFLDRARGVQYKLHAEPEVGQDTASRLLILTSGAQISQSANFEVVSSTDFSLKHGDFWSECSHSYRLPETVSYCRAKHIKQAKSSLKIINFTSFADFSAVICAEAHVEGRKL